MKRPEVYFGYELLGERQYVGLGVQRFAGSRASRYLTEVGIFHFQSERMAGELAAFLPSYEPKHRVI